jgi:putative peptidoglycan lipid II flippase
MKNSLARATFYVTTFSIISILLNLILQLIVANYFGANISRDAYLVAISIPLFVTTVINGSFGYVFIPYFVEIQESGDKNKIQQFLFSTILFLFSFLLFVSCFIYFFDVELMNILFPNLGPSYTVLIHDLFVILLPSIFLNVLSTFLSSLYQIQGNFLFPALANALNVLSSILFFLMFQFKFGIHGLAYGYLLGSVFSFLFQIPVLAKLKFTFKTSLNFLLLGKLLKLSFPLFIGGIFFRFSNVFEKIVASNLDVGSVSYLGYSGQILTVLGTLTSNGVSTVMFPLISRYWSNENFDKVKYYTTMGLKLIFLLTVPISLYLIFFGKFIIGETFERGLFTTKVTNSVYLAIVFSMAGFLFQSIGSIIVKLFYISGYTGINTIISSLEVVLYMLLAYYLVKYFSFLGLPIALSISSGFSILLSLFFMNYKIIKINYYSLFLNFIKIFILSLFSIMLVYFLNNYFFIYSSLISFIIFNFIGLIFFLVLSFKFKIDEIKFVIHKVKSFNIK